MTPTQARENLINGFDYENQSWVEAGKYVRCGHPEATVCGCYARAHAGEERKTKLGKCFDCASGIISSAREGFALYMDDGASWWYCLFCGSNHVDILDESGAVLFSQGNLYESAGEDFGEQERRTR